MTARDHNYLSDCDHQLTTFRCGASFNVSVVSPQFEGKNLLARHRMVSTQADFYRGRKKVHCMHHSNIPQTGNIVRFQKLSQILMKLFSKNICCTNKASGWTPKCIRILGMLDIE